jgi:hypothetical protein
MSPLIRRALPLVALLGILCAPAKAADVEVGEGPICDTQMQAEQLASLYPRDTDSAIREINAEANNSSACEIANVAYLRSAPLATVRTKDATFHVVKVLIIGIVTAKGVEAADPVVYYSLFKVDEWAV